MSYIISAVFMLAFGHFLRMIRWRQFIEVYEKPNERNLLRALSLGFLVNFFVPFRVGDLVRAVYAGRKMKNGIAFSLVTIITERYLDVLAVGFFFGIIWFAGFTYIEVQESIRFYALIALILFVISVLAIKFSVIPKYLILKFSSIFNNNIKLFIMYFAWTGVSSFKDIYKKLNKAHLFFSTFGMWLSYICSYYLFSLYIRTIDAKYGLVYTFSLIFSKSSLDFSTAGLMMPGAHLFAFYMLLPLLFLFLTSFIPSVFFGLYKAIIRREADYINMLPQLNKDEQLHFLNNYFLGQSKNYLEKYIEVNRSIHILQDFSAGSNATTMLCLKNNRTFYRKYAFGKDAKKLYEQIEWIEKQKEPLPMPLVLNIFYENDLCYYDMEYKKSAVGFFNYIHSVPYKESWNIIESLLNTLNVKLYTNKCIALPDKIEQYIQEKVTNNLNMIFADKTIASLMQYETLIINNVEYRNLTMVEEYLSKDYLLKVFKHDFYSTIHGDLTVENIICVLEENEDSYYIIDPNTGNIHDSPYLDYAKLLQSLHGGYEFYMKTKEVRVYQNHIEFLNTRSGAYDALYDSLKNCLCANFSREAVRSMFFHEIVHWLRLMPYKINKDNARCLVFYAGLVIIINDIIDMFGDSDAK